MGLNKARLVGNDNDLTNQVQPCLRWWSRLLLPAAILLAWELVAKLQLFSTYLLPPPHKHMPPHAWIPLLILWLGIGEASKDAVIRL